MTLPDGNSLPASPENRRRAADLWQLDNKGQAEKVEDELDEDDEKVERAERELKELRRKYESEREERQREDSEREQERAEQEKTEKMAEKQTAMEQENERLRYEMMAAENERLKSDLNAQREVQKLRDELAEEREKNRPRQEGTVTATEAGDAEVVKQRIQDAIRYSLPLGDPAADVIADFANCIRLEDKIRSVDSQGNARISTVTELFEKTDKGSPDMKLVLKQHVAGSSLLSRLKKYRVAFHSQKHPDKLTMLVCVLKAVEKYCPEQQQKMIAVLKVAASLVHSDRIDIIADVRLTGQLPTFDHELNGKRLAELAGMT